MFFPRHAYFYAAAGKPWAKPETLNTWKSIFDKQGRANDLLLIYDEISRQGRVE